MHTSWPMIQYLSSFQLRECTYYFPSRFMGRKDFKFLSPLVDLVTTVMKLSTLTRLCLVTYLELCVGYSIVR